MNQFVASTKRLGALCIAAACTFLVVPSLQAAVLNDGPYVTQDSATKQLNARWICHDQLITKQFAHDEAIKPRCGFSKAIQVQPAIAPGWQFTSKRWAAISDIHGQYDLMLKILQAGKVIDAQGNWAFGSNQLVVVGDIMDRGDKVNEALWHVYVLQQQAKAAGGALHMLPGNHETMVLRGDLRYVHPNYQQAATKLNTPLPALYGANTVLGAWLRQLPLFVRINDTLFVHGGISPEFAKGTESVAELQHAFAHSWGQSKDALKQQPLANLLQTSQGPLWYRGYFKEETPSNPTLLAEQLARFGAKRIVVGHTTMDDVYQHHNGVVYSVDSNIKEGESGAMLHYIDGQWFKSSLDGELKPVGKPAE